MTKTKNRNKWARAQRFTEKGDDSLNGNLEYQSTGVGLDDSMKQRVGKIMTKKNKRKDISKTKWFYDYRIDCRCPLSRHSYSNSTATVFGCRRRAHDAIISSGIGGLRTGVTFF